MTTKKDEEFLRLALAEAKRGAEEGEVPVGAIIVIEDEVVASAHNKPISLNDPTAHAEILAIREAAEKLGNYRLTGGTIYVTIEPCIMCIGAILQARLSRLVYGADDPKFGGVSSLIDLSKIRGLNHKLEIISGVLKEESASLLRSFFGKRRREKE
ncbi:MAG: tRNA adenosine(34) deaminase TadA [Acidobacteria bacterium]|nr:tRNA adenosine(34) deaminase TadA [Acidobacteriota bacterium]